MRTSRGRLRLTAAVLVVLAVCTVFVARLVDIQVVSAATLQAEAADKRGLTDTVYGTRGAILDANGAVLADSVERYRLTISPRVVLGLDDFDNRVLPVLNQMAAIVGRDPAQMLADIEAVPDADYLELATDLTLEQFTALSDLDASWDYYARIAGRSYPNGAIAGNLVGFIGTDGPLAGLELSQNQCLEATDGEISYERSADGVRIPDTEVVTKAAVDGGDLTLTIDRDLQWYAQERLAKFAVERGATWASSVIMRVSDGAVMAITDWPTLDPNEFKTADPGVTGSRAFAIPYEPGSIMKPINAAIALNYGSVTPTTQLTAPTTMDFGDAGEISDIVWHAPQITVTGSLVYSSNTATSQIAASVPDDVRRAELAAFGFGSSTEVGFTGESAGDVPDYWDARSRLTIGFGQGITTTILQMASAYQTLANGGVRMPVRLVQSCTLADGTVVEPDVGDATQVVSESAADQTIAMMEMVAEHGGVWNSLQIPGYRIAAKSGTAEVAEGGVYTDKVVVSYAAVAPADDPQYVVVLSVGLPYAGLSSWTAPVVHDLMAQTLTTFRVMPSSGSPTELPIDW